MNSSSKISSSAIGHDDLQALGGGDQLLELAAPGDPVAGRQFRSLRR